MSSFQDLYVSFTITLRPKGVTLSRPRTKELRLVSLEQVHNKRKVPPAPAPYCLVMGRLPPHLYPMYLRYF